MHDTNSLFDSNSANYISIIDQLMLVRSKESYSFTEPGDFELMLRKDVRHGMQVYWGEVLARAHLSAVVAILRSRQWINAVVAATNQKNLLAFAAAFRGFIESSADTYHGLEGVAVFLAENNVQIGKALSGTLENQHLISTEVEEKLIHFKFARHLARAEMTITPQSHKALQVRQYIEGLEKGQVHKVIACYQSLCDLTHPGASSVWMWLTSENGADFKLNPNQDESMIAYYLTEYRKTFSDLIAFAFNPAILALNVLNYFPLQSFHTTALLDWNFSGIPLWKNCQGKLESVVPLARKALSSV